jgi:hypothetical protein
MTKDLCECRTSQDTLAASDDGELGRFFAGFPPETAGLLLFTFATVLSKSGSSATDKNASPPGQALELSLLSHPLLYAQLDSKSYTYARPLKNYNRAMISHGRLQAGQRFWVSLSWPKSTAFSLSKSGFLSWI